ncbi:FxsB family cyclophane-forming radical SAM/SPASM peptide maturase [Asanoa iriomotensis]|uniref:Radical SAM protein n=1 Tax=Asanoa iriomotensis TaxID=234613 RepID=A0ABQ4CDE4_9ACTN|nr:FxsB family cyclophane-forming radical SAM/SPASM peptide maturase [Asanoa iriomotensis]GIF60802.1 radical SAM protein [Asanoa iriomotensis]
MTVVTVAGTVDEAAQWPTRAVVDAAFADPTWRPLPFREFILKVHGRCNLACDYCYMYEMADQSWRTKPAVMERAVFDQALHRIAEHARTHGLSGVDVIFHGGEPLMVGTAYLDEAATAARAAMPAGVRADLSIQTNGTLLTESTLRVLAAHDIGVGVSLDGGAAANDRHRRYRDGRGSHAAVMRGIAALRKPAYRHLFTGVLCTVDLANDPVQLYEDLLETGAPGVDFLLPLANWESPPPGYGPHESGTRYAEWLIAIFDRWYDAPTREVGIRFFDEIMNLVLGGASTSEIIGLSPVRMLVIDTDGSIEQVDGLKSAFEGAPDTGLSVRSHPFDAALTHPAIVARQRGLAALSTTCLACPVHEICGAGLYSHRYRPGTGFLNPSVYCTDLRTLIDHIAGRVGADLRRLAGETDR